MNYSAEFIRELKKHTDIVEVISAYVELQQSGNRFMGDCPFHDDHDPSFAVYPETQSYYCFGCGAGSKDGTGSSDVIAFLMAKENLTFGETIRRLAKAANMDCEQSSSNTTSTNALLLRCRKYYLGLQGSPEALMYLASRNITQEDVVKYRIGYSANKDKYHNRISICVFNEYGKEVGFAYRTLPSSKAEPKYLNSSESALYKKSTILYGLNFAKELIEDNGYVVLVEGYFDTIALQKLGIPAVGIMSSHVSDAQITLIKKHTNTVVLFLDGDTAGHDATMKGIKRLRSHDVNVQIVEAIQNRDPDEMAQDMGYLLTTYIEEKRCLAGQYLVSLLTRKYQADLVTMRLNATDELKKLLPFITNKVEQASYICQVADAIGIPSGIMLDQLINPQGVEDIGTL